MNWGKYNWVAQLIGITFLLVRKISSPDICWMNLPGFIVGIVMIVCGLHTMIVSEGIKKSKLKKMASWFNNMGVWWIKTACYNYKMVSWFNNIGVWCKKQVGWFLKTLMRCNNMPTWLKKMACYSTFYQPDIKRWVCDGKRWICYGTFY